MKRLVALLLALGVSMTWAGAQPAIKSRGSKKDPFTFVQVSDPQLGFCAKGQDWQWTVGNLKTTVAQINALKPAFVIVTGDLVQSYKNADQRKAYLENIARVDASIPVFHLPGNHDIPDYNAEAVGRYLGTFGYDRFAFTYNGSAFVGLNSTPMLCGNDAAKAAAEEQLAWFAKMLKRYRKCNHIFVFSHHPLVLREKSAVEHKSAYDEPFRTEYAELMKKYGVAAVFAGHTHITEPTEVEGMPMITVGASSYPLYGGETGINVVEVTPENFHSEFVVNGSDKKVLLH